MPEISRFSGIRITMYYAPREHPPPHSHAEVGEEEAVILIATGQLIDGWIPNTALSKVQQWCELHRTELQKNWTYAMSRQQSLESIKPLP
jgi:Domain of unknown function (DUF4160)